MVADIVNAEEGQEGHISVSGLVAAMLRFHGILVADRNGLSSYCERIFKKATDLLNTSGQNGDELALSG